MVRPKILCRNLVIVDSALRFRAIEVVVHPSPNYRKRFNEKSTSEKKSHIKLAVGNIYKFWVYNITISVIFMRISRFQFFTKLLTYFVIAPLLMLTNRLSV